MGIVFTDFTFLNTPTYISVVILSFFLLRLSLSSPHEPRALPEVNRLALGGTVSPRETPSPSCPHFCSVECGHTHMSRYGPLHCLPFIFPFTFKAQHKLQPQFKLYRYLNFKYLHCFCNVDYTFWLCKDGQNPTLVSPLADHLKACLPVVCGSCIKPNQTLLIRPFSIKEANSFTTHPPNSMLSASILITFTKDPELIRGRHMHFTQFC